MKSCVYIRQYVLWTWQTNTTATKLSWMLLYINKWVRGRYYSAPQSAKKIGKQYVSGNNYRTVSMKTTPKVQPETTIIK